ncbi:MAG: anaerobic ribonucleoside-triphosphate reductase activating protein [Sulfuricurvum sp.]|uniref:anaerobic ribonucleoside-triphosphate reductase activating protein n=1 Tax=Sulfuricurvum sp. TaxID=2025608 RepID=UPI0025F2B1CB|nr:anaerobic ribonucleoside-triphosphate reductase activating protein [Sulfuricurvum sp.]MBV5322162.1 anaerobic ribonucleoside-triphosphate reductase activating protein [Sulfuricurvum sp.]
MKALYDLTPFTLLDFPDIPAAIFWFAGCNLRCVYCYNPDIVLGSARIDEADALSFLTKRAGLLEGVVLSGGEATLYPNLLSFCRSIKALGYKIKLDTNGMRPDIISSFLEKGLLDYVALDYKAPSSEMLRICGGGSELRFWESFHLIKKSSVNFEVRTTFHPELLTEDQIITMANKLKSEGYKRPFYVQLFRNDVQTLGNIPHSKHVIDYSLLEHFVILRN